jgi:hypothetical protein
MMHPHREALAYRFIAATLAETRSWPADLQIGLHELAFRLLPELVLELKAERAQAWVRDWRARMEAARSPEISAEDSAWVADLARAWSLEPAPAAVDAQDAGGEIPRLAELIERLGPVALALPWRREPPARA